VAYVDALARNGYIVFKSDYRGHGNSEGSAPGGYGSPAYTSGQPFRQTRMLPIYRDRCNFTMTSPTAKFLYGSHKSPIPIPATITT
jgi:hypothetical protein